MEKIKKSAISMIGGITLILLDDMIGLKGVAGYIISTLGVLLCLYGIFYPIK